MSSSDATDRSSSETAGGGLWSESVLRTILGLSTSSCTKDRATDTLMRKKKIHIKKIRKYSQHKIAT